MLLKLYVCNIFIFTAWTSDYVLAEINDKTKAGQRTLVDLPHTIVNEVAWNEKSKTENAHVMIIVLIKASDALTVNYKHAHWITARSQPF